MSRPSRHVCFTTFDTTWTYTDNDNIRYIIYQEERCPETNKHHLQGYVEFNKPLRLSTYKKYFPQGTHFEERRGTRNQARDYCKKDDSRVSGPWEFGNWINGQGSRSDLKECADLCLNSLNPTIVATTFPDTYIRYSRGIKDLIFIHLEEQSKVWRTLNVQVLWGEAGTGKTRYAVESSNDYYILTNSNSGGVWFDGYNGQKTLIIDDFYGWIKFNFLLRILDGYQLRIETKGNHTYALWDTVYITSNNSPDTWYDYSKFTTQQYNALFRRLSNIVHYE